MIGQYSSPQNVSELLERRKTVDKKCMIYGSETITYKALYMESVKLLDRFTEIELGNNVGIFLPNSINYAKAYFSILFRHKTVVPIPYYSKCDEIISNIIYCELNVVITDEDGYATLKSIVRGDFCSRLIVYIQPEKITKEINTDSSFLCEVLSDFNSDVAVILHTSGTTSNPKRVMLTHMGLLSNINSNILSLKLDENDVTLIALPMCFGYCNTSQFLTHIYLGATIVVFDSIFNAKSFFNHVEKYRVTNFTAVPTMLKVIDSYSKISRCNVSSLRYLCFGGGNVSVEIIDSISAKLGTVGVVQTYGQTEAGPRVTALLPEDYLQRQGSVGKTIPDVIVRIVDDDGVDCSEGDTGNIIVSSPAVMKGYYKNKEETEKVIKNGWLYTGDMGYFDDGFLYLNGRKKNIIICGGLNIYPEEIEEVFQAIEGVEVAKVYGKADDIWGEIPVADIVITKGSDFEKVKSKVLEISALKLSDYKIPREIQNTESFARTYTGKIRRLP